MGRVLARSFLLNGTVLSEGTEVDDATAKQITHPAAFADAEPTGKAEATDMDKAEAKGRKPTPAKPSPRS